MARHPFGPQGRRKARNQAYVVLALLVIAVAIAFIYGPFGKNEAATPEIGPPPDANADAGAPEVDETAALAPVADVDVKPEPEVEPEPEPEPSLPEIGQVPEPESTIEPNPEASGLIAKATALVGENPSRIIEARESLNKALYMPMSPQQRAFVKDQLSGLADKWLLSRTVLPDDELCESYLVKSGDQLRIIGERHKVPYEILVDINKISRPEALQAGQTIKVINGPFRATVYRSTFTMDVYLQNTFVRSFRVGLGKPGMETPIGLWRAKPGGKLVRPVWTDPITGKTYHPEDPDYPLGSRWIGLEGLAGSAKDRTGFAIHGTKEPEQIGSAGSQGCIRMHNGDAILVYNLLFPGFSQVEVVD
ncbi:MAG: L,D-transpeptidase family protein [Planctomycetota bacterium]|jgi:lipoprotein-anchoring transpeptidase ErfK/SrfK